MRRKESQYALMYIGRLQLLQHPCRIRAVIPLTTYCTPGTPLTVPNSPEPPTALRPGCPCAPASSSSELSSRSPPNAHPPPHPTSLTHQCFLPPGALAALAAPVSSSSELSSRSAGGCADSSDCDTDT